MNNFSQLIKKYKAGLDIAAQRTYRIGKRRYILAYGIGIYGGGMFIFSQINAFWIDSVRLNGRWLAYWLIISAFAWVVLGWLFGWIQWRWSERRVLRMSER